MKHDSHKKPKSDDVIKSADDLRDILNQAGLPNVPVYELKGVPEIEARKIQLDAIRRARDRRSK